MPRSGASKKSKKGDDGGGKEDSDPVRRSSRKRKGNDDDGGVGGDDETTPRSEEHGRERVKDAGGKAKATQEGKSEEVEAVAPKKKGGRGRGGGAEGGKATISKKEEDEDGGFPVYPGARAYVEESNILKCLDQLQYGPRWGRRGQLKMIGDACVQKSIKQLSSADYAGKFTRRITSLTWHEKYPYALASASKFGDIMFISGVPNDPDLVANGYPVKFETKIELEGGGAGYSVTAMKFHERELNLLYRVGIDGIVARMDLAHGETTQFHSTGDYYRWFCAMDLNFPRNLIVAGDNKGLVYKLSLDGKLTSTWRLHQNKIHHCEFSKKDPNLLVTASLDKTDAVKLWDIRYIKESSNNKSSSFQPLHSLNHSSGLNIAKFSPMDGSRLLTSDQEDEIRIYQGPLWKDYLVIKHHHRQFQHITPIKADWHPVNDYVVIGRYPQSQKVNPDKVRRLARAVEFFDSYTGELINAIYPPLDEICSLNVFNPTGEYLATGMNSKLVLWKPGYSTDGLQSTKRPLPGDFSSKAPLSEATRNILRGRRAREYSPVSASDDEDANNLGPKKKKSKTATSTTSRTNTKTPTTANTTNKPSKKKK